MEYEGVFFCLNWSSFLSCLSGVLAGVVCMDSPEHGIYL